MDTDGLVRDDFPSSFRGWKRAAVLEHLEAVAEEVRHLRERPDDEAVREAVATAEAEIDRLRTEAEADAFATSIAAAAEADAAIVEARGSAAEIIDEAREEAEDILAGADAKRWEADREAAMRIAEAEQAVDAFLANAFELGDRVSRFGQELARSFELDPSLPKLTKRRFARTSAETSSPAVVLSAPSVHG